jgi:hypothetical protein
MFFLPLFSLGIGACHQSSTSTSLHQIRQFVDEAAHQDSLQRPQVCKSSENNARLWLALEKGEKTRLQASTAHIWRPFAAITTGRASKNSRKR